MCCQGYPFFLHFFPTALLFACVGHKSAVSTASIDTHKIVSGSYDTHVRIWSSEGVSRQCLLRRTCSGGASESNARDKVQSVHAAGTMVIASSPVVVVCACC